MTFVCVAGSSGVGKTTFAKLLHIVLPTDDTLLLCGDDCHKWPRNHPEWNVYTHFHPFANNIEQNHAQLEQLLSGKQILRQHYNHETGLFDLPVSIQPKTNIIYEGLHSLFHKPTFDLADLKIYVDTDENLKNEWKLKRDVAKRGYSPEQVQSAIARRKKDEQSFIQPQKKNADVVVKFFRQNSTVEMEYVLLTGRGEELMQRIKNFYDAHCKFLYLTRRLSLDLLLCQQKGGNVSVKYDDRVIVSASGVHPSNINMFDGYAVCNRSSLNLTDDESYMKTVAGSRCSEMFKTPSMETGFHFLFDKPVVLHTHPIYLNAILCSKEAFSILEKLFEAYSHECVKYVSPGRELVRYLRNKGQLPDIVFLKNHGLIVAHDSYTEAYELTEKINDMCGDWLKSKLDVFVESRTPISHSPLFPDAAVFPELLAYTNDHLARMISNSGITPDYLPEEEIKRIQNMNFEKMRKSLS